MGNGVKKTQNTVQRNKTQNTGVLVGLMMGFRGLSTKTQGRRSENKSRCQSRMERHVPHTEHSKTQTRSLRKLIDTSHQNNKPKTKG